MRVHQSPYSISEGRVVGSSHIAMHWEVSGEVMIHRSRIYSAVQQYPSSLVPWPDLIAPKVSSKDRDESLRECSFRVVPLLIWESRPATRELSRHW